MSIRLVCDICGKDQGTHPDLVFNEGDITLPFTNYDNTEYIFKLKVSVERKDDQETLANAKSLSILKDESDYHKLDNLIRSKPVLKNPKPHMCTTCTKESVAKALKEGYINPKYDIKNEKEIQFVKPSSLGTKPFNNYSKGAEELYDDLLDDIFGGLFKNIDKTKFDDLGKPKPKPKSDFDEDLFDDDDNLLS